MPRKSKQHKQPQENPVVVKRDLGWQRLYREAGFRSLAWRADIQTTQEFPPGCWAKVNADGRIIINEYQMGEPEEWAYVFAHCLLHLGFGHFKQVTFRQAEWNAACDCYIALFLADMKIGTPPGALADVLPALNKLGIARRSEQKLFEEFCALGIPEQLKHSGTAGPETLDMLFPEKLTEKQEKNTTDWQLCFAQGLQEAVADAVDSVSNQLEWTRHTMTKAQRARNWFITNFPLLGSLAASFTIIEDPLVCHRMDINVAAINMQQQELYFNPHAALSWDEMRFVMAHELLHAGLRHDARCEGRDFYLWNVACDYVINGWLVEMGVGMLPSFGALYDPELKNESAEAIYDRITRDLRAFRKLATFRGVDMGDMLGEPGWHATVKGQDLDDFYRRCLSQGLLQHEEMGRGYISAGLIEEIRALSQPAIPWDVELAQWFDHYFPPLEKHRTYMRLSRRQSATPDIPRPHYVDSEADPSRTFGVLLDTSGSMDRTLLAKALGAIASYSIAREVLRVRVVFCDAATFDQGYMAPEDIAGKVKVRGRGGTVLQPGVDLLELARDFPQKGPLLIITDGYCDNLRIRREHAFLLPASNTLPFPPKGPVFRIK